MDQNPVLHRLDPTLCTHIIVGFLTIQNGSYTPEDPIGLGPAKELRTRNPELKIMVSIGTSLAPYILTPLDQRQLAQTTIQYARRLEVDGVDYDWEFPRWSTKDTSEKTNFADYLLSWLHSDWLTDHERSGKIYSQIYRDEELMLGRSAAYCRCTLWKILEGSTNFCLLLLFVVLTVQAVTMVWYYMCRHVAYLQYSLQATMAWYYMCRHVIYLQYSLQATMAWYYMCRHVIYLQYSLQATMAWYYMCRHVIYLQYSLQATMAWYYMYMWRTYSSHNPLPTMVWYYMCRHVAYLQYSLQATMAWYYMCRHVIYLQYSLQATMAWYYMCAMGRKKTLPKYRLVVLGDGGVGKSAITIQFFRKTFVTDYDPTIEDAYVQEMEVEGEKCIMDVLDTAGQEQFSAMRESYMLGGDGFLLVYSVTDRQSFDIIEDLHTQILRVLDRNDVPAILVGNKVDLGPAMRQVQETDGRQLADHLGIPFLETSAKPPPLNVERAFYRVVSCIRHARSTGAAKPSKSKLGLAFNLPVRRILGAADATLVSRSTQYTSSLDYTVLIIHTPGDKSPRLLLAADVTRLCPPPHRNPVFNACHMAAGAARVHPSFPNFTLVSWPLHVVQAMIIMQFDFALTNVPEPRISKKRKGFGMRQVLREAIQAEAQVTGWEPLLLSVAVAAPRTILSVAYDIPKMADAVDFINLMTYDLYFYRWYLPFTAPNAALFPRPIEKGIFRTMNTAWAADEWYKRGMPKEKIMVGIPFYGRTWRLANSNINGLNSLAVGQGFGGGFANYPSVGILSTVCKILENGGTRKYNEASKTPYVYRGRDWISYDDEISVAAKIGPCTLITITAN
ncbi:MRAS [Cordylochernes scorpioides]|uniref:MRAS n=1 Tax=Cordylochernes scorpioides TaxID=51811 RepID=A0ABY6JYB5_9ARAC|nr:MRAS [Cordylochernes scorpioides]